MSNPPQLQELNVDRIATTEQILLPIHVLDDAPTSPLVEGETAVRLYQSIRTDHSRVIANEESFHSSNEYGQTCRICRYVNNTIELIACPCSCSGSVGFVHLKCLQRWIRFRRDKRCEICKEVYNITLEKRNYAALFVALLKPKYLGSICKNLLSLVAVTPLVYFTMNQLVYAMDSINENPDTFKLIVLGPCMLLGTSIYFFLYFDWALSCIFRTRNILLHWWNFGDQDDDEYDPSLNLDSLSEFFELD